MIQIKGFYNKFLDGASSIVTSYLVDGALDVFYQLTGKVDSALGTEMTMDDEELENLLLLITKSFMKKHMTQFQKMPIQINKYLKSGLTH